MVSGNLFPSMIHAMFQVESQGLEDVDEVLRSNSQLFRFLHGIVERGERMARLIKDCIPTLRGEPVMFGGCYFAGTGRDAATEQAFASGVLMRMIKEDQDSVTWTEEALDQDAAAARAGRPRPAGLHRDHHPGRPRRRRPDRPTIPRQAGGLERRLIEKGS